MSPADYATLGALALLAFCGAFIFGITGFGSALFTIPLATHLVPLSFALALFSLLDCTNAWRVGLENPKAAQRGEFKRLLPMVVVGTVIGLTLLVNLPRQAGMIALGAFVLAIAVSNLVSGSTVRTISQRWAYVAGAAGGITGSLFGAGGPPYVIYLSRRGLTREQFRATLGVCTIFSISFRVIALTFAGLLLQAKPWLWALAILPASLAGLWVAGRAYRHLSRELLLRAISLVLVASGISLITRGLA